MEEKEDIASKTNQYFQKLNKDIHTTAVSTHLTIEYRSSHERC